MEAFPNLKTYSNCWLVVDLIMMHLKYTSSWAWKQEMEFVAGKAKWTAASVRVHNILLTWLMQSYRSEHNGQSWSQVRSYCIHVFVLMMCMSCLIHCHEQSQIWHHWVVHMKQVTSDKIINLFQVSFHLSLSPLLCHVHPITPWPNYNRSWVNQHLNHWTFFSLRPQQYNQA